MKTAITLTTILATCCLAAEVASTPIEPKAQGALLLLPLQQEQESNSSSSTTPRSVYNGTENLDQVNAKTSERQVQGSEKGEYHVYLQDGRLQKVQYTTSPITSGQQVQQQQSAPNNYNQQLQVPEILSPEFAEKRGVYFVQVPQERIQAFQNYARQSSQQTSPEFQSSSSQYNQEPAVPVVRYLPVPLTEDAAQYRASEQQVAVQYPEVQPREQQAIVQYSEVQPITGPVYSYSPQAFTRILRYAPVY